ncbi:MAG: PQQ-like beta-propeller repeat protein [Anaerolineae bacterium]|nr:PQQ-like beta-propeller repeat protein [Anaerolineae bacterium]
MLRTFRPRHVMLGVALLFTTMLISACSALPGEGWANFTVDGQYIYVAYQAYVFRVNTGTTGTPGNTGVVDWAAKAPNGAHMYTAPALGKNGLIYVGAYDKEAYAFTLQPPNRSERVASWDSPTAIDKFVSNPVINEELGMVYFGHADKGIYAYDMTTGAEKAKFTDMNFGVWGTPLLDVESNTLYVPSLDHHLYALDPATLAKKWDIDTSGALYASPTMIDGKLYIGTFTGDFLQIDPESQKITNSLKTNGGLWATPLLEAGLLYFGDLKGNLYAVDLSTFTIKYSATDTENFGAVRGKMVAADTPPIEGTPSERLIFVASENKSLRAYTPDLQIRYRQTTEDRILSDLVMVGDKLVFTTLSDNQLLVGYNLLPFVEAWRVKKPTDDDVKLFANMTIDITAPTTQPTAEATAEATSEATSAATAEATASQ